ncbi:hypothetical protein L0222_23305 [bacterium]|nr:hypothetical protein [bacterium]MCI0602042.1 hypothetical protein [bacterium]
MNLLLIGTLIFIAGILTFLLIARKGRKLRTAHVLPPETDQAFLETSGGEKHPVQTGSHFYIGKKPDSNLVVSSASQDYEVCIFYHRKRFAFQTLSGGREVLINGEEQVAGYLSDGDVLKVAGESFTFRSFINYS